jgi:hypothetical protein
VFLFFFKPYEIWDMLKEKTSSSNFDVRGQDSVRGSAN